MRYISRTPTYEIDLSRPARQRWNDVVDNEIDNIDYLLREARESCELPSWLFEITSRVVGSQYEQYVGRHLKEMEGFSRRTGESLSSIITLNYLYELSHFDWESFGSPFGCTAGMKHITGMGMVHVRSMDWPIEAIGEMTRIFRFRCPGHDFISIGVPGYFGVLSGMVPGEYSAAINWAPPTGDVLYDASPSTLLRDTLTKCHSYEQAKRMLSETSISTPVFFTLCGRDDACVIERQTDCAVIREMGRKKSLVQANHHMVEEFEDNNEEITWVDEDDEVSLLEDSEERYSVMRRELNKAKTIKGLFKCLNTEPVKNEESYQQMIFIPVSGDYFVKRLVP